ncbi:hypothetical protein J2Z69_003651 [Paenibacillus shirakamiensis]|uniref:Phage protein n=1 Tax=Paenibacillus shirakamiensis TaxID=1265935 RepID=A0ABS4JLH9_9BACL|nr:hypothetical protein [Paenibacillus shirakamiensis]MBP2002565.1 hypothetical protein [Paenibacillus shirakamiensis]
MNINFGRICEVMTGNLKFTMQDFNMEATIPFDHDPLPNESEIKIWNLSDVTVNKLKTGQVLTMNAGYQGDTGLVLQGNISKVQTSWSGVDKITTIKVLDSENLDKREVKDMAFAKNTFGGSIIKQMAGYIGLPIAQFDLVKNYQYKEGYTATGKVTEIIAKVAKDCDTEVYINKGKLYVRNLKKGKDSVFKLDKSKGMIGSPERFEDEGSKGYNLKSQLQYRITTASVIDLSSQLFTGRLYVRSGSHHISRTGDFTTEVEAIL